MESFAKLRQELDTLGYTETLKIESLPLVQRLLSDLKVTTENLKKYMTVSQQALEERDNLLLGAEPYKCDNAKLIRECNELHLAFIHFKEQHEKTQKDLKTQVLLLENQLTDCSIEKQKLAQKVKDLQLITHKQPMSSRTKSTSKNDNFQLNSAMAIADKKIASLSKEIQKLKEEQFQYVKDKDFFKTQLHTRDEEIDRLNKLLEGGRTTKVLSKDCCYKNIDNKIGSLQDEINSLKRQKNLLQNQLKEATAKQHEAMRRAIHLAERNKQLENEMKDIDQIALAVEAECNDTVKDNAEKVTRLQDKLNESVIKMQNLERENVKLTLDKKELSAELDAVRLEKKKLQTLIESEADEKKRLTDRFNNFTIIEHDLNMEIDRLLRISGEQKRKIAELECQVTAAKIQDNDHKIFPGSQFAGADSRRKTSDDTDKSSKKLSRPGLTVSESSTKSKTAATSKTQHKKTCRKSSILKQSSAIRESDDEKSPNSQILNGKQAGKCCCEAGSCVKTMKELLDKEMEYRQEQAMQQIDSLRQEKEYYMKEYHKVLEEIRSRPGQEKSNKYQERIEELLNGMKEKDLTISAFQNEIRTLNNEKYSLSARVDSQSKQTSETELDGICQKTSCRRKARELEVHKEELKHIEKENNSLKIKIQALNETTVFDQERMKKAFQEMEGHILKLENERRDLVVSQCTSRSNVTQLEEDCNLLREQLRSTKNELNNQKANYNQLKILHDQTERALNEAQTRLLRAETELQSSQTKISSTHRETAGYEREIGKLQGDIEVMKMQLSKIDKDKDELLNVVDAKTEKIDFLEGQLKEKKNLIQSLESEVKDLRRKVGKISDETNSQDLQLRSSKQELAMLQKDYEAEKKFKESAVQENKRLQDDLASVTRDCREARKELEISTRQVEDLKRQLQHYVAEVKRTEDLISHKMAELASQVASLEMQLKQGSSQSDRYMTELKQLKDLCLKLDTEKDELKHELRSKDEQKSSLERENKDLRSALDKDQSSLDGVEKLLNDARQEVIEHRLLNQDLQSEIIKMRSQIQELQDKLATTGEQLDLYQEKAFEYSQQNKQLRREVANERFARARDDDAKRYPSL
ncbi:unnamed protein product [Phaedon cochleariae]|uniref:Centrosomal protein of 135 kDa n=1 Tax=Phaedon cochleariae TaxID=80249 RepID=A0A9N9SKN0_PHACE|nr:unnamed protein product [Phaedon cochleariae]